VLLDHSILDLL